MEIKEYGINILHFSVVSAAKERMLPNDAGFLLFFFAPVANCIFTVWVPPCEEKCRCPEGCNPFGSGFPIGASSTLLAHDFARQSLVCYTFCDRDAGKELSPYRTDHFLWQQKDEYLQAREACGYSFFGCRRCGKAEVTDRRCCIAGGAKGI